MKTLKIGAYIINLDYYHFANAEETENWRDKTPLLMLKLVPIIGVETEPIFIYIEDYPEDWMQIIEDTLSDSQD